MQCSICHKMLRNEDEGGVRGRSVYCNVHLVLVDILNDKIKKEKEGNGTSKPRD